MFGTFFINFTFSSYVFFILIFFLEDKNTFALSPETALSRASWLIFWGYPFNLVSCLTSGYVFVYFGRRKVIFFGFTLAITASLLLPFIGVAYQSYLYICFIAVNIGTALTQNPPLIADYIRPESIGLAYSIQGLLTSLGTIFAIAGLFQYTKDLEFTQ